MPQLRSLSVPFIADHITPLFDPKELAHQILDVIFLRPEVELCYVGISHKCFEILENRPHEEPSSSSQDYTSAANGDPITDEDDDDDDDDDVGSDEDQDGDADDEEDDNGTAIAPIDPYETDDDLSDDDDESDEDSWDGASDCDGKGKVRLRLREILFYDDKVAIFKARHGRI